MTERTAIIMITQTGVGVGGGCAEVRFTREQLTEMMAVLYKEHAAHMEALAGIDERTAAMDVLIVENGFTVDEVVAPFWEPRSP